MKIQAPAGSTFALVGIHSIRISASQTLEAFAETALAAWARNLRPGLKVVTVSRRSLRLANNVTAIEVVHEIGTGEGGTSRKIFAVAGPMAAVMDAETYSASWKAMQPHFDRMVDSFIVQ